MANLRDYFEKDLRAETSLEKMSDTETICPSEVQDWNNHSQTRQIFSMKYHRHWVICV